LTVFRALAILVPSRMSDEHGHGRVATFAALLTLVTARLLTWDQKT
jgi:hypothetical protein